MYVNKSDLCLTKDDLDNLCKNCGSCCRDLTLQDKIELVRHFKHPERFLTDICPFSSKYGCIKYNDRPTVCREWKCGVVETLQKEYNQYVSQVQ